MYTHGTNCGVHCCFVALTGLIEMVTLPVNISIAATCPALQKE